tara:strand:+ start:215 stop:403 length:189 start_codon:yes stop_codon:yes gene_type:complete
MRYKIKKMIAILLLLAIPILVYSCEDDALLVPQLEEECVGSYCNLSMPNYNNALIAYNPEIY